MTTTSPIKPLHVQAGICGDLDIEVDNTALFSSNIDKLQSIVGRTIKSVNYNGGSLEIQFK